ncbi:MAG TPA: ABC transporter substrate-binding protein [Aggregatilineaceae bacterium]|jgi:polar amino acid transport system substrate-binding protein|nr:ABC transporter substrate-binding protein [Aggregatilineaceae bacterium]
MIRLVALRKSIARWHGRIRQHPRVTFVALIAAALLVAGWGLTRPGAWLGPQDLTWHRIQVNRDLYVGIDPSYPPFAEWAPEQIDGLEADLAREIARRLAVQPQILIMGFDGLYDSLYVGQVDMVISGLHVDPGRTDWVYYSRPYFDAGQILVSRTDAPVQTIRQLDGKTVAVELASAGDMAAQQWQRRLHALHVERFMLPDDAMQAVQTGEADAALVDTISARLYLKQREGLAMAARTTVPDGYVIAMRRQDYRLTSAVDRMLANIIADGTLDVIIARWL